MPRRRERYFVVGYTVSRILHPALRTSMVSRRPGCLKSTWAYLFIYLFLPLQLRKPLIERKRRERINNCLDQLKETVIGAFRLDVSISARVSSPPQVNSGERIKLTPRLLVSQQQSKLEKADILEMTVKHLQNIQSNKVNGKEHGSVCCTCLCGSHRPIVGSNAFIWIKVFITL